MYVPYPSSLRWDEGRGEDGKKKIRQTTPEKIRRQKIEVRSQKKKSGIKNK